MADARAPEHVRWATVLAIGSMVLLCLLGAALGYAVPAAPPASPDEAQEVAGVSGLVAFWLMAFTLLLGWAFSGRWLVRWWQALKSRRVGLHNWTSIAVLAVAGFHTFAFIAWGDLRGLWSGIAADLLLISLFASGWWRLHWIRAWGRRTWRIVHWELALGAIAFSALHWAGIEHGHEVLGIAG